MGKLLQGRNGVAIGLGAAILAGFLAGSGGIPLPALRLPGVSRATPPAPAPATPPAAAQEL